MPSRILPVAISRPVPTWPLPMRRSIPHPSNATCRIHSESCLADATIQTHPTHRSTTTQARPSQAATTRLSTSLHARRDRPSLLSQCDTPTWPYPRPADATTPAKPIRTTPMRLPQLSPFPPRHADATSRFAPHFSDATPHSVPPPPDATSRSESAPSRCDPPCPLDPLRLATPGHANATCLAKPSRSTPMRHAGPSPRHTDATCWPESALPAATSRA
jgi:hypothetical protein